MLHVELGAIGSLKGFAKELSIRADKGVVEAIQSMYSIAELIEELYYQIRENCVEIVTVIGYSWGVWLVSLLAEKYPEVVKEIILVGSGPLEDKYVSEIGSRRVGNLSGEDLALYKRLINNQVTDEDMKKIPAMFENQITDGFAWMQEEIKHV